jgi:cysteine sulfinate desulfinase/cysteine desulfurase-like protein
MGVKPNIAMGAIRFSLGRDTKKKKSIMWLNGFFTNSTW